MSDSIKDYLASIGRRGGKSGTGKSKCRSRAHYQRAARVRWANERARLANAQHTAPGEKP